MSVEGPRRAPPWTLIFIFWVALGIVASLQETWLFHSLDRELSLWTSLAWEAPKFVLWGLFTPLIVALDRKVRNDAPPALRSLAPHLPLAAVLILVHLSYATLADYVVLVPPRGAAALPDMLLNQLRTRLQFDALSYAGILGSWFALDYYGRHRRNQVTSAHLERELARAELQALKMQLQPHFLFNALQALSVLNHRAPDVVTENLLRLGSLYRYLSRTQGLQLVELRHEIDFVMAYLSFERLRFPDRLHTEVRFAPELARAAVPHLILQPLVENAIQHGLAPAPDGGTVRIHADSDGDVVVLTVSDDGVGLPPAPELERALDRGLGLAITRTRLERLYGNDASLTLTPRPGGGTEVCVQLPREDAPPAPAHPIADALELSG